MKENCFGYFNGHCTVLTEGWNCETCKFFATKHGAEIARIKALESLERRGLKPCVGIDEDGHTIMTVTKL